MTIQVTETVFIKRSPKDVSEFVSNLGNEIRYWEGVKGVRLLEGDAGAVGARYERTFEMMGKENKAVVKVVEHKPGKRTVVESEPGPVTVKGTMTYEADPEGTKLTLVIDAQAHGMARLFAGKIRKGMEENTKASVARLKTVLEAEKKAVEGKKAAPAKAAAKGKK